MTNVVRAAFSGPILACGGRAWQACQPGRCAQLADVLLRRCPRLKMLVTSREGLGIAGETLYPVPSLSVPDSERALPLGPRLADGKRETRHFFRQTGPRASPPLRPQMSPASGAGESDSNL